MKIVSDSASRYRIVVPDDAEPVIGYAAQELRHLLAEISRVTLPILSESQALPGPAFLVGPSRRARRIVRARRLRALKEDGVLIKTAREDVALLGQNGRGQLYSVYVLLERFLGVRFLARDCTVAPRRDEVELPAIDYAYSPPFAYRETLTFDSFPKKIAARQRLNGPFSRCDEEVGGRVVIFPYVHSFAQLVPPDRYFADHPEYFSLVKGKRTNATVHGQLCLTNPEVLEIATAQVMQWMEEHPEAPILDVSQNDGEGACECERCAAVAKEEGSQHGPILRFVNAIAEAAARKDPQRRIETLAYAYSIRPPARTRPRENVIIRLCHTGCYFHGLERCAMGADFARHIARWNRLARRVFIWHYATNFHHYLAPNQNLRALGTDIKYYAAQGVNGLMVQGNYQCSGGELAELRQYLASQLMWDPSRDPATLRREFCGGYYGPAAEHALEYLALMDGAAADAGVHAFGSWDPQETVPPGFVAQGLAILDRARACADSPEIAQRVERLLLPLWYMQLTYPGRFGLSAHEAARLLGEFDSAAADNRITFVGEGFSGENMRRWLGQMEARYGRPPG